MAELVAKRKLALRSSIAKVLERVICLREAFAQLLQERGVVNAEEVTARKHSHFVDILKQVHNILGGAHRINASTGSIAPPSPRQCLSTAFAALRLYEPSHQFLDAPDVTLPAPEYDIAEDEAGLEEAATAIDLARKMEEKAAPVLDRFGGVAKFIVDHYHTAASAEGLDPSHRVADGDDINIDAYGISKRTMYEAYHLLDRIRKACLEDPEMPPLYNGQPYGWFQPGKVHKSHSAHERYDRDCAGFAEVVSETAILARKLKWSSVQDEFTRGDRLIMADPSQPIPFWVVFASQLFIDNFEILGDQLENGWTDVISKWKRRLLPSIVKPQSILVKRNAVFAGVWAHHLLTLFHTTAIAFVNVWGAVFAMNQFYHAMIRLTWMATRSHPKPGDRRFWVGQEPQEIKDFWKQWCLCNDTAGHARVNMTLEDVRNIVGEGGWIEVDPSPGNVYEMVHEYDRASSRPFREAS
ncbi:uncharacterized protein B0T15DRAFT_509739 [Chaetomium strumarium]|uniref:DUF6604 domain-containing protein n=1 Tax=Chaetomium strumarium TaxID=1170767 RepID=A0AAJ0M275_9PEZI|nr:hypothetical protein B0T15DRAFT_509739 [Chaetomium strumarium]